MVMRCWRAALSRSRRHPIAGRAAALALSVLAGCAGQAAPLTVPMRVEIPVATPVYCAAPAMEKPALPIAALDGDSAPADTIRAYAETVVILKGAVEQRDLVLAGCAKPQAQSQGKEVGNGK